MDIKESYQVLELEIGASRAALDAAYFKLLERWHPDRAKDAGPDAIRESGRMVQAINDAYQTLIKIAPDSSKTTPPMPMVGGTTKARLAPLPPGPPASIRPPVRPPGATTAPFLTTAPFAAAANAALPPTPAPTPEPAPANPLPPPMAKTIPPWAGTPPPSAPAPAPTPLPEPVAPALSKVAEPAPASTEAPAPSKVDGPTAAPKPAADFLGKTVAFYNLLFPPASPRRRYGPFAVAGLVLLLVVVVMSTCSKSPEQKQAEKIAIVAKTTGLLTVKSNRANTTIEATRVAAPGEAPSSAVKGSDEGAAEQQLTGLPPGKYVVIARTEGWPDIRQEANVTAAQTSEVAVNFKSGSLRLDTVPTGAIVRLGSNQLGKTPLVIPQLPPGECQLSLEYPSWPAMTFKTTITENVEAAATVRLPHGKLIVESDPPGATILSGGRAIGTTPLTIERVPVGVKKLTLQSKDFPAVEVTVTVSDQGEAKVRPVLATGLPELDPAALLHAVWVYDDPNQLAPAVDSVAGPFEPRNGVVKNLHRKRLYYNWLNKRYRLSAVIKGYDKDSGQIEFTEQKNDLARYRILTTLSAEARNDKDLTAQLTKGATFVFYGNLTAVEEPHWPAKVITFEFSAAEAMH